MTLDDLLNALSTEDRLFVVQNIHVSMPVPGWLVSVKDFIRIDDYIPDDMLLAHVVSIDTKERPWTVVIDL